MHNTAAAAAVPPQKGPITAMKKELQWLSTHRVSTLDRATHVDADLRFSIVYKLKSILNSNKREKENSDSVSPPLTIGGEKKNQN